MKRVNFYLFILLITIIILPGHSRAIELVDFSGRISNASDNKGIGNLVVKLTPPRNLKEPQKITTTNDDGQYNFVGLKKSRYLLEVYQGPTLLYRNVVDLNQEEHKTIVLHSKG